MVFRNLIFTVFLLRFSFLTLEGGSDLKKPLLPRQMGKHLGANDDCFRCVRGGLFI